MTFIYTMLIIIGITGFLTVFGIISAVFGDHSPPKRQRKAKPAAAPRPLVVKDPYKPMLAKPMPEGFNPTGWLMSEKLDGVRAIWTGYQLISRNGNPFHAPRWFTEYFPKGVVLDGELYIGRGKFQETVGRVRSHGDDWEGIRFMAFDIINSWESLESRQKGLYDCILIDPIEIVQQTICLSPAHLVSYEQAIIEAGGEGVMLRKPGSYYEHSRTDNLLKLKRFQSEEATVLGYEDGTGQLSGKVGSLRCEFNGKTFSLGSGLTLQDRASPPPVGSRVTFKFFELTRTGVPRFPVFITTRDYEGYATA